MKIKDYTRVFGKMIKGKEGAMRFFQTVAHTLVSTTMAK
jgi:hypothetical protein